MSKIKVKMQIEKKEFYTKDDLIKYCSQAAADAYNQCREDYNNMIKKVGEDFIKKHNFETQKHIQ